MKIMIGSARSDENKGYTGGKPGDQRQSAAPDMSGEVSQQAFYNHKKGWVIIRALDPEHARYIAESVRRACDNPNVGYSQSDRYSIIKYGTDTMKKCNCDCSSLIRQAVIEATGKDPGDFTTADAAKKLVATGLFRMVAFTGESSLFLGDILCTQTRGHIVAVTEGPDRTTAPDKRKYKFGIDVAKWQGSIDWLRVKASGHGDFAVLKVTQKNNSKEDAFEKNYKGTKACGIPIAVYRYVYAKSVGQAVIEANGIVSALKDKKIEGEVWLDLEDDSIRRIGKAALTLIIDTMAGILKWHGYNTGIYCNRDWYEHVLDGAGLSTRYKFWIAKYGINDGSWENRSDSPFDIAAAWQYTSKGKIPGITGFVDLDLIY